MSQRPATAEEIYRLEGAVYERDYGRDPSFPHPGTTDGQCADSYWNTARINRKPSLVAFLAEQLRLKMRYVLDHTDVDWIVSSPYSAITVGHEVAKATGAKFGYPVVNPHFNKEDPNGEPRFIWDGRYRITDGERLLQIEEEISSFTVFRAVGEAILRSNVGKPCFLQSAGCLVYRGADEAPDLVRLADSRITKWPKSMCPLCKAGSPRIANPKRDWHLLVPSTA